MSACLEKITRKDNNRLIPFQLDAKIITHKNRTK
uniref:Uncharacterized protein n=1 Tax=Anguilla anguilla TaxID=7936 RepID=A0A0E9TKY0_ANGAN